MRFGARFKFLFHFRGPGIEAQFSDDFLQREGNSLSPEKPGAAAVAAPGLDQKKKWFKLPT
jgi:hypothetical protein